VISHLIHNTGIPRTPCPIPRAEAGNLVWPLWYLIPQNLAVSWSSESPETQIFRPAFVNDLGGFEPWAFLEATEPYHDGEG
jgi:hypothetical protein